MEKEEHIVISLGGSLIVPSDEIDVHFLKSFISTISEYARKDFKFVIITGGGRIARSYTLASKEISNPTNDHLDWIGIATTRLNAELVKVGFGNLADESIIFDPDNIQKTDKPIIVGGGWKPGNSSDLAAVHSANTVGAKKIINLSNIDYVYDKDPRYNQDAQKFENITWNEFRKLLPNEWDPGLNSPFDPVAAKKAEELGLEVVIMNGKNIENLKNFLDGKEFVGTVIK